MNTKNSKTSEPHRFKYNLIDKLDLKNPNKNMALASLNRFIILISLKFPHLLGMIHLIYLMDRIIYQKYTIIWNIQLKNMKQLLKLHQY